MSHLPLPNLRGFRPDGQQNISRPPRPGGGDIIFGVRADLNLLQRMGQIISLGSKRVIRLSLMKCAMLFTINFCQAGRLSKR